MSQSPQPSQPPASPSPPSKLQRVQSLSRLLDNAIAIPGTDYAIGLDPIIGLLPGGGDLFTGLLSVYIVLEGFRLGASMPTLTRMATNIVFDLLAGTVPIVGDLFDVAWKANSRNVAILEAHLRSPTPRRQADRLFFVALITGLLLLILSLAAASLLIFNFIVSLLSQMIGEGGNGLG
ncbi:MAG: DUF4112 domain-containing protein [Merismopedia sp. SIO2A8]|nr:DUF4112 domain-containing protein [Merismopedia sp. SIO2A8]